ncbi:aminopeptidase [Zooshikella harenae]|uniref:Aminopeptidase n=1 Tax=Zooshikella harenae TaxID=2827238 RepID=A0ABS5ZCU8_9GAMM|nr:aminopeptidase [Zooshikella harenae]MBU2710757.1 aminopeptidase [Zooshikella harenae]
MALFGPVAIGRVFVCRAVILLLFAALITSCETIHYYQQAAFGQLDVVQRRKPVVDVVDTTDDVLLKQQLDLSQQLLHFAEQKLHLPVGNSYQHYADLERAYIVWNVFAAPELSLEQKTWCYPLVGCLAYRGYYHEADALQSATRLQDGGFDTYVAGIKAYSTLGWFNDPLLNTFIHFPEAHLAELLIHELAHQWLYVPGDTDFNESLATVVALEGVKRWYLQAHPEADPLGPLQDRLQFEDEFTRWLLGYRQQLGAVYRSHLADDQKLQQKHIVTAAIQQDYQKLRQGPWKQWSVYDEWIATGLNNAKLASIASYYRWVPALQTLLAQQQTLSAFYKACEVLAELDQADREAALMKLSHQEW